MPAGLANFSQREVDGWLVLDDGDGTLHTGVLAVVDPAAAVSASVAHPGASPQAWRVDIANDSLTTGRAHGFTLVGTGDDAGGVVEALGARAALAGAFDVVQFGVATDAWETLSSRETQILLDVTKDGNFEYLLVAADLGLLQGLAPTGTVATALFDLVNGGGVLQFFATADFNQSVQVLTVDRFQPAGPGDPNFGFLPAGGDQSFDYLMLHFQRGGLIGSQTGSVDMSNNVDDRLNPSLQLPAGVAGFLDYPRSDIRRLLWLFPDNQVGSQVTTLRLPPTGAGS
jgi:hypothetical protein